MRRILFAVIALFAAAPVAAQQTQAFESAAGYTVQLPAAWRPMPQAAVDAMQQAGARAGSPYTMEAAFSASDSPTGLPYVAVAWVDVGQAITPEQFAEAIESSHAQSVMQQGADAMGGGVRMEAPAWDEETRTAWAKSVMPPGSHTPWSLTASTLLPDGRRVAVFAWYAAPGQDDAKARAALLQIIRSLRTQ